VRAPLENDDRSLGLLPSNLRCGAHARRISPDDDDRLLDRVSLRRHAPSSSPEAVKPARSYTLAGTSMMTMSSRLAGGAPAQDPRPGKPPVRDPRPSDPPVKPPEDPGVPPVEPPPGKRPPAIKEPPPREPPIKDLRLYFAAKWATCRPGQSAKQTALDGEIAARRPFTSASTKDRRGDAEPRFSSRSPFAVCHSSADWRSVDNGGSFGRSLGSSSSVPFQPPASRG
jgi:hypothetical protein